MRFALSAILFIMTTLGHQHIHAATDATSTADIPAADKILESLRPEHPRLLLTAADFEALKQRVKTDEHAKRFWAGTREEADTLLDEPPLKRELRDGVRLLFVSRDAVDRIYTLALAWHLNGEQKYVDRAWEEMQTIAGFKDWNPDHFLDTAEMTHALAIGYDWLYHALTDEQRKTIRTAIVELGIKPALAAYDNQTTYSKVIWWRSATHNWNQVCGGGIGLGALAIAEDEPKLAGRVLREALVRLIDAMKLYQPDGGYMEGPGYWSYGTRYNVYILAGLETALGTTFGLAEMPAFDQTGTFPIQMTGPTGESFNFADVGRNDAVREPALFWLARRYDRPAYAHYQVEVAREDKPLNLVWYDPKLVEQDTAALPLDAYYQRVNVGVFREKHGDPNAMFLGWKGGDNKFNHSNLDLGSFVFEADGVRWAIDLGKDDYNLPGYWQRGMENRRWRYYRLRAEGHNTLVINPDQRADQDDKAAAPVTKVSEKDGVSTAVVDLTAAYQKHGATKVIRTFTFDRNTRKVTIEDKIKLARPGEVHWFMHTAAEVEPSTSGGSVTLKQGDATLRVARETLIGRPSTVTPDPDEGSITIADAAPLPTSPDPKGQADNQGVRKLAMKWTDVVNATITVTLEPIAD